jgi:uncharacterized protein
MEFTLVLTHACNLGCPYCYMGQKFGRRMPKELGEKALAWAFEPLAENSKIQVGYFGGEPLLAYDLLQHFHLRARELARPKNIKLVGAVTTNATLLTEEQMSWMVEHGVVVAVSLDGVRAAHDLTRPFVDGSSSHDAVLRGLQIALKRAPLTEVLCVIDPANVRHMAESARFILEQGARVLSLSMNYGAAWDEDALRVYGEQMELVGDEFERRFMAGSDVYIAGIDSKIVGRLKGGLKDCDRCAFGVGEIAIAPSGNLYPCERLVGEDADERFQIGHIDTGINQKNISDINIRRTTLDPLCAACGIKDRCMNTCGCSNMMSSGDEAVPGAALCQSEQIQARVADRAARNLFWAGNPVFLKKFYYESKLKRPAPAPAALRELSHASQ